MVAISRIRAGQYLVSDGRFILKDGSRWYVVSEEGEIDFGPVTTLAAAKEYVAYGNVPMGQHNTATAYGRRQSKKEYSAYLAAETKKGNYGPLIISLLVFFVVFILMLLIRGH